MFCLQPKKSSQVSSICTSDQELQINVSLEEILQGMRDYFESAEQEKVFEHKSAIANKGVYRKKIFKKQFIRGVCQSKQSEASNLWLNTSESTGYSSGKVTSINIEAEVQDHNVLIERSSEQTINNEKITSSQSKTKLKSTKRKSIKTSRLSNKAYVSRQSKAQLSTTYNSIMNSLF